MQGAVFPGNKTVALMEFPDPAPGPNEVVLEMKASGICGSDLKNYRGTFVGKLPPGPIIAGHEPCGIVLAKGSAVQTHVARIGSRVMVHHYKGCGWCSDCMTGWTHMCADKEASYGLTAHGGHARYLKVPADTLVELPDDLSFEVGAAISCGSGTAWGALKKIGYANCARVVVVGQGPVGQAVTQFVVAMGGEVIAIDINHDRLLDAKNLGAAFTIHSGEIDAWDAIRELTHGKGVPYVVETSGSDQGGLDALRCAGAWGKVAFVGMGGKVALNVTDHLIRKQLRVFGSWTFSKSWQEECAAFVSKHQVDVEKLFSNRWELGQIDEAYRLFDQQVTGKSVIVFP
jgi:threonine dehydrogenase-like Zn-dependent dehydrogenase